MKYSTPIRKQPTEYGKAVEATNATATPAILIVDDESAIRRLIRVALDRSGFVTIDAADGVQAAWLLRSYGGEIALAILDLIMPHASGLDVANEIEIYRPTTLVMYISGFGESVAVRSLAQMKPVELLIKPFTGSEIVRRVRELLARSLFNFPAELGLGTSYRAVCRAPSADGHSGTLLSN